MEINPNLLRRKVLDMVYNKKSGHIGGSFSLAELIAVLYSDYDIGGKDKLILSKGHAVPILYAALNVLGKITDEELNSFREVNSRLQGHPDKVRLPLMDATTGSLGQGLSIAIGHALAKNLKKEDGTIFCVLGDGELQEGQVWEALSYFPKTKLTNLVCVIDWNKAQSDGFCKDFNPMYDNFKERIFSFGWDVREIDGHDLWSIRTQLMWKTAMPMCLILDTVKGKGVSFMENDPSWHSRVPTEKEYQEAIKELCR